MGSPHSYLKAPVTSNFSLTTTKITENGITLYFLETLDAGILIRRQKDPVIHGFVRMWGLPCMD